MPSQYRLLQVVARLNLYTEPDPFHQFLSLDVLDNAPVISQRTMDCDFGKISKNVYQCMNELNTLLQGQLTKRKTY